MSLQCSNSENRIGPLDTLAQKRTRPLVVVLGKGSEVVEYRKEGRAKRKTISQKLALSLVDVATKKGKPDRVRSYWNTYHCQNEIIGFEGRIYGKYCKNRFCTVCCAIRKATIINKYLPFIKTWSGCHFLTLTIKAIPAKELPRYIRGMLKIFKKIINKYSKRFKRGCGVQLQGIKSLECNFNPRLRTYNPHFHLIVRTKAMGEIILSEWLSRFNRKHVQPWAQKLTQIGDVEKTLIEIIKYGSKIFTETDLSTTKKKPSPYVYVSALDNILDAMAGHRIFDRFGFNSSLDNNKITSSHLSVLSEYDLWMFQPDLGDWLNPISSDVLSGYRLDKELNSVLLNNLDLETE